MKRSLRKIPALLLLVCLLVLTGCASKEALPKEALYQQKADYYVAMLAALDKETLETQVDQLEEGYDDFEQQIALYPYIGGTGQKFEFTADAYLSMFKSYLANMDEFGTFVSLKEYEGGSEDADGNVSYSAVYEFEKHDMRITLEFDKDDIVTTVSLDPIYSYGEIAEKAAMNTLIGMGSVFAVLIILCFLISCFKYIHAWETRGEKKAEKKPAVSAPAAPAAPLKAAVKTAPLQTAEGIDPQIVAVITAAVAASMGTSKDGFVVRSIKRRSNNKWKRA